MATRNIVPRNDNEGGIGTSTKSWSTGSFYLLTVQSNQSVLSGSFSGSFEGSFSGDGSGITGVTASQAPGGSDTDIQFNKSATTSGSSNLQFDYANNIFKVNAGRTSKTTRVTAATYTLLNSDFRVGVSWTLSASVNLQLPLVSDVPNHEFRIKDEHGNCNVNNIHVLASGSDLIDGAATASMINNYAAISLYNDGTSRWFVE